MKIAELKQICSRPDVVEVFIEHFVLYCKYLLPYKIFIKPDTREWSASLHFLFMIFLCAYLCTFQIWDATAADPKLLVYLKSYRNTVPVPRHWCQKRKFLQVSNSAGIKFTSAYIYAQLMGMFNMRKWESWVREDHVDKVSLICTYLILAGVWLWHCWSRNL